ncbi:MAG TPA: hypothetical protein VIG31_08485 [Rhodanobacteraceae bacterium]
MIHVQRQRQAERIYDEGENCPKVSFGPHDEIYVGWSQPLSASWTGFVRFARSLVHGERVIADVVAVDTTEERGDFTIGYARQRDAAALAALVHQLEFGYEAGATIVAMAFVPGFGMCARASRTGCAPTRTSSLEARLRRMKMDGYPHRAHGEAVPERLNFLLDRIGVARRRTCW